MKHLLAPLNLLILIFAITSSCQKDDLKKESSAVESGITTKGKPSSGAPYILAETPTALQVYGVWHAGNDYCTWGTVRTIAEFDSRNRWIIDRGDGKPSVNLVILSFVNPLK